LIDARMTVVKLTDGALWVHSPAPPIAEVLAEVTALGPVRYIVAPNLSHYLHFADFASHFPDAHGFLASGLAEKLRLSGQHQTIDPASTPWQDEISSCLIEGLPLLNEIVFVHQESHTLIVTDLLFRFGPDHPLPHRILARLLGVYGKAAMSRTMKLLVRDRKMLAQSIAPLLQQRIDRIVLAHGAIVEHDAHRTFHEAFRFLSR
jgi:hypothetical protein